MTSAELEQRFSLEGISGGNAVFNIEKLDWMNGQYIAKLPLNDLAAAVHPLFEAAGLASDPLVADGACFHRLLELLRPRAKRLTDFVEQARPLMSDTVEYESEAIEKHLSTPELGAHISALVEALRDVHPFNESHVEAAVRGTAATRSIKAAILIHAIRVAVTGRTSSPGLFEVLVLIGRDRTLARLELLLSFLATRV
jgi:glutamyl-tRNA synthetase